MEVKLVLVSDFPQARMTRLIHPDCLRSVERERRIMRCLQQNSLMRSPRVSWLWMSIVSNGRVGAGDIQQQVVLTPRRFGFAAFTEWASIHLTHADAVVLEATSHAWLLYDQLQPLVAEVVVAHPQAVKLIAAARVKTDSRDTIKLASLLA